MAVVYANADQIFLNTSLVYYRFDRRRFNHIQNLTQISDLFCSFHRWYRRFGLKNFKSHLGGVTINQFHNVICFTFMGVLHLLP